LLQASHSFFLSIYIVNLLGFVLAAAPETTKQLEKQKNEKLLFSVHSTRWFYCNRFFYKYLHARRGIIAILPQMSFQVYADQPPHRALYVVEFITSIKSDPDGIRR
jgi:hypothetical protein